MRRIIDIRDKVLKILSNRLSGFYLAGGTALSLYYFRHRESFDLDFFTQRFNEKSITDLTAYISKESGVKITLEGRQSAENMAKMLVYSIPVDAQHSLKIDFVEDYYDLLQPLVQIDGIPVLSKEDIYRRKIFTACGSFQQIDSVGRKKFIGGRQEAKDFFDLYYLSKTYMPLSVFAERFCGMVEKEGLVLWYKRYDRDFIKMGLLDIITQNKIDYREMEKHLRDEIDEIIKAELTGE